MASKSSKVNSGRLPVAKKKVKPEKIERQEVKQVVVAEEPKSVEKERLISPEEVLGNLPLEIRDWNDPEILDINEEQWNKPGTRVGLVSGTAFLNEGQRCGLIWRGFHDLRNEATRFDIFIGHLVDKEAFQKEINRRVKTVKFRLQEERKVKKIPRISDRVLKDEITSMLIDETAKALAALIPKIRKPKSQWHKINGLPQPDFVRLYIMTSPTYDGPHGERVASKLRELRNDDVRVIDSNLMEIKGLNRMLGVLVPSKNRLPSKYYSTAAEKEIDEKEGQMSKDFPDLWVVGPFAAAVFTPNGVRERPYVMVPALRKLEEVRVAENQVGIVVLEFQTNHTLPIMGLWNYRDLIKNEREFINPPRGVSKIQEKIVRVIQERGGQTIGLLADHIGDAVSREKIEQEIKDLVEPKMTKLKTWPGLGYNPESQKYNFHLDWIKERLRYPDINSLTQDSMLFFGCLHAGYTTTDYEHFVKEVPKIILEQGVNRLFGLGDMIAGLHHDFHHTGEVFGSMNYTEQEIFAAEILATVLMKVFTELFNARIKKVPIKSDISQDELAKVIKECLTKFDLIPGNHDLWQEGEGHTPLTLFYERLTTLLMRNIGRILIDYKVSFFDLLGIIQDSITLYPDYEARVVLPSGVAVAMQHPHMGRAQTTSLRAQSAIGLMKSQVAAIANFHTATIVPKWQPDLGQCITVQAGTQVIYTRFERRKMKRAVDFGPILLKTYSKNSRILKLESSFYNRPYLKEAIPKTTDPAILKRKLNILT